MTDWLATGALWGAFAFFACKRARTYLHIFQQDEYDAWRFVCWMAAKRAFDTRASLALGITGVIALADILPPAILVGLSATSLAIIGVIEADPTKIGKKRLNMTPRAKRILWTALVILMLLASIFVAIRAPLVAWILLVQATPFALCAATLLLQGYEIRNNQRFVTEAREKLAALKPTIVGITGSFGKTSVKHILGHILSCHTPTLVTPGSVNTELGISRIVRERLTQRERFFVCEMGAYGPGSIARLCQLAPPTLGVITAVGHAHYERFKALDTVAKAKFEMAEAALTNGGKVIVFESAVAFDHARTFIEANRAQVLLVGFSEAADLRVSHVKQTSAGTSVDVIFAGRSLTLTAPLFGTHHGLNMALAFAAAIALGLEPNDIVVRLANTPQIQHRSEIKTHVTGATLIDDAYNSNSIGFTGALQLLDRLRKDGGRRVLVTPGMAELGTAHDEEHAKIGEVAAHHVDILIPVLPERIQSLTKAFVACNPSGQVIPCASFSEASNWMVSNLGPADVVLLENDLPDLYERTVRL